MTSAPAPATESHTVLQPDGSGTLTDIDGNTYSLVRIGDQWWMAENLNVARDSEGNPITGYCYRSDPSYCDAYGRLYTWHVAMNGSTEEMAQGICPEGWHVPSDAEWRTLFDYLGGEDVAGGKMKGAGTTHWDPPNTDATNSSGFNGLPAGGYYNRAYEGLGIGVHFWSSTESGSKAGLPTLHTEYASIIRLTEPKSVAASVRCIMD
jgi:uncharacterized protein (TIGR02145 family)